MRQSGFTLLELSIVIVIIGLIVAGISAGQSLVRQASMRTIATDFSKFITAMNTFKLQYDALPGDMTNAYDYWGASCDASNTNCNGDGNGQIFHAATPVDDNETYRAWQHFYLAGLIPDNMTGLGYGDGDQANIGQSVPEGPLTASGYAIRWDHFDTGINSNWFQLGTFVTDGINYGAAVRPREAYNIDLKLDDGAISTGIVAAYWSGATHASDNCKDTGAYKLDEEDATCRLGRKIN